MSNRRNLVSDLFVAFTKADRDVVENLFSSKFTFSAPPDPFLDRNGFFEKCWPGALHEFEIVRLIEHGDEVVVTFKYDKPDGTRACNADVITFDGDKISRIEVYFGWDLPGQ
jgi:ketosteroid isomerase-like protein